MRHLPGHEPVYVAVSHELLDQMQAEWSDPLQVHIERDSFEPYGWRMTFRSLKPVQAFIPNTVPSTLR